MAVATGAEKQDTSGRKRGSNRSSCIATLATADRVMAQAAEALGMEHETFF